MKGFGSQEGLRSFDLCQQFRDRWDQNIYGAKIVLRLGFLLTILLSLFLTKLENSFLYSWERPNWEIILDLFLNLILFIMKSDPMSGM